MNNAVTAKKIIFWFSILTLGSGYLLYLCLRILFNEFARDKRNLLVTLRTDGEIKAVMRGNTCVRYIMKVENHRIDPDGFDLFKGTFQSYAAFLAKAREKKLKDDPSFAEQKLKLDRNSNPIQMGGYYQLTDELRDRIIEANSTTLFEELFGVVWVGFPPYNVLRYSFRWIKFGQQKATDGKPSSDVGMHPREEEVDSLFYRYPAYGVIVDGVETGAGSLMQGAKEAKTPSIIQVRAEFVFETVTKNPQKTLSRTAALSSAGDWQQALVREISDRARMWLGSSNWDELVGDKPKIEAALKRIRDDINGVDGDGLPIPGAQISSVRDYGQMIVKITMPKIDLKNLELQAAYEKVVNAQKQRDANMATAEGQRALAAAPVQGKADGFKLIGDIPGGKEMFMAEQLGNIRVYAPGRDGLLFNIADEVTGGSRPATKNTMPPPPSSGT